MSDPRPAVTGATEYLYSSLPELYRDADAAQDTGPSNYPLLRFLALLLDQLDPIDELVTRFGYVSLDERAGEPTPHRYGTPAPWQRYGTGELGDDTYGDSDRSDLVSPTYADAGWLPWLAQLLGVPITGLTVDETRERLLYPSESWAHGTPAVIAREVRRETGEGTYVDVQPHDGGNPFVIAIITKADETYGATSWGELKDQAPTWADLEALGSWHNAEVAAVMLAASTERPAGYRFVHHYLEDL